MSHIPEEEKTDLDDQKRIEFYSASVNAWFNTKLEFDKNILTLSAGAVGLLVALMTSKVILSVEQLIIYFLAILCFVISIGSSLWIFQLNSKIIEEIINETESRTGTFVVKLDKVNYSSFFAGIILSIVIGFSCAINFFIESRHKSPETNIEKVQPQPQPQPQPQQHDSNTQSVYINIDRKLYENNHVASKAHQKKKETPCNYPK